ncbi:MAG: glycosyltransferase family 4 protein [Candidatus Eisenbacteria sp.]|nr:glycosyltransferase family 4 protein [Candidatus Eisenbacteria bacterium]
MPDAPRVCHLVTRLIVGGAQRIALETAAHFRELGWRVELWSGPEAGPEGSLREEARRRGLPLREVPDLVRDVAPRRDWAALCWLRRAFRAQPFDLVHTHSAKAGILGRLAAAHARVPYRIHTVHGWSMDRDEPRIVRALYAAAERIAARRCQKLIAVSEAVREMGLRHRIGTPAQYEVIHGGIALPTPPGEDERRRAREALGLPQEAIVVGTIGRLDEAKDPLGVLATLAPLLADEPRLWVAFIGDGPLRDEVARARAQLPAPDRVRLCGLLPDAAQRLAAFDLFVLASRREGFPLVVLEAMAAGLPVVTYDVAGVREAVCDEVTGFVVAPGDAAGWQDRLASLIASREARERMGATGRQRVAEHFTREGMLARTLALYGRLNPAWATASGPLPAPAAVEAESQTAS